MLPICFSPFSLVYVYFFLYLSFSLYFYFLAINLQFSQLLVDKLDCCRYIFAFFFWFTNIFSILIFYLTFFFYFLAINLQYSQLLVDKLAGCRYWLDLSGKLWYYLQTDNLPVKRLLLKFFGKLIYQILISLLLQLLSFKGFILS